MPRLHNMPIFAKVAAAPAILLIVLVGIGSGAFALLTTDALHVTALDQEVLRPQQKVAAFDTKLDTTMTSLYRLVSVAAEESDIPKITRMAHDAAQDLKVVDDLSSTLITVLPEQSVDGAALSEIESHAHQFTKAAALVVDMVDTDPGTALTMMSATARTYDETKHLVANLASKFDALEEQRIARLKSSMYAGRLAFTAAVIAVGMIAVILVIVIIRAVSAPIMALTRTLQDLTRQDYSVTVPGLHAKDELGTMARAVDGLRQTASLLEDLRRQQETERQRTEQEKVAWLETMSWAVEREILTAIEQIRRDGPAIGASPDASPEDGSPATERSAAAPRTVAVLENLAKIVRSFSREIY
ncbi:HAMP domain-containing protein [Nitrospirillum sp. BR 11163]|uniref:HAMP domain-containing protein n=1 Tax=Nitrospirillum sp. BR 11163 TaxID=3104323 RepID=UPI002AFF8007|nr:HAMP domain-containing protein [Nitrospirillum sp. BR 11163]MEA1672019.1 HAMP domain-containing protein [Nitrospirillum sp. BR 11163]